MKNKQIAKKTSFHRLEVYAKKTLLKLLNIIIAWTTFLSHKKIKAYNKKLEWKDQFSIQFVICFLWGQKINILLVSMLNFFIWMQMD